MEYFAGPSGVFIIIGIILFLLFFFFLTFSYLKKKPVRQTKSWLSRSDVVFLDTETTGFRKNDEIIEIGIIDNKGNILLEERVMPDCPIPIDASAIHGITKRILKETNTPKWPVIHERVKSLLNGKIVIMYNAEYDVRMLHQTCKKHGCGPIAFDYECAMLTYAKIRAEPNPRHNDFKWHKLTQAARYEGVKVIKSHSAIGDCLLTLNLARAIIKNYT